MPSLVRLLNDKEARIRRRAALAVGRTGAPGAAAALIPILGDPDPEVRQMAAFALGLLADRSAVEPLIAALADTALVVQASAAEALGLIGEQAGVAPVAKLATDIVATGAVARPPAESSDPVRNTPAAVFRACVFALAKLKAYDALAAVVLEPSGQPKLSWWPVAFALQRLEDPRALRPLIALLTDRDPYTRAFAAKGLGAMKDRAAVDALIPLVGDPDRPVAIEAIRSLGRIGGSAAAPSMIALLRSASTETNVRVEAITALGSMPGPGVFDMLVDLLSDRRPAVRGAAIKALARVDPEGFVTVFSGLDADANWSVRAALATALGGLTAETGMPRLRAMLSDEDAKVLPAVIGAIAKLKPADAGAIVMEQLKASDPVVRAAAANAVGQLKPSAGAAALVDAYQRSLSDTTYVARAAVLNALEAYGREAALPLLTDALADKDWALRLRAAALMQDLDGTTDALSRIRPVPSIKTTEYYSRPELIAPPFSTQAFIETDKGTIQLELAVLDAPITSDTFITLARQGFFDGLPIHRVVPDFVIQAGDPRGDSEGGPGFTIRDEINQLPYLRGTVGMALDWADTGGSQFFITHSPQPHLDARYTVFGRVIAGMDVVDRIEQWDVIRRVRVWDGSPD